MIERICRWTAILIAALAAIDPQVTLAGRSRPLVGVLVSGGGAAAQTAQRAVQRALASDFEVVPADDPTAKALVVVGDRYPDRPIDQGNNVSTVTLAKTAVPAVVIQRISAPAAVPPATAVRLGVDVAGSRLRGTTSQLSIRIRGAAVANRSHTWAADDEVWHEDVDVVPVGEAPFVFNVQADHDSRAVVVDRAGPLRVLVVESRPSWATAFVRRALEADPRFDVSGLSVPAPQALVRSGASPAIPDDLRAFDVIVAGGLDRLSASNLTTFERFSRERGGTLMLLPDAAIPTAVLQKLLPGVTFRETLLERAAALDTAISSTLQASELLEASRLPIGNEVLARAASSQQAVVWNIPFGDGRIVVSGAMDAWRYRGGDSAAFDRFWRSLVAGAALSARPPIDVELIPERAAEGDRVRVVARVRRLEQEQLGSHLAISARVGAAPIRLWPDATAGAFAGSFIVDARPNAISQRVTAALADGTTGFARLAVEPHPLPRAVPPLAWLSSTRGGINVAESQLDALSQHLRRTVSADRVVGPRHPMRSGWWFVPFAACASVEWWLRRRRGLR